MKRVMFTTVLAASLVGAMAQPSVQSLATGDYWRIQEYNRKLQEFANEKVFRAPVRNVEFPSGSATVISPDATRYSGINEVTWETGPHTNVSAFVVEFSHNNQDFIRAGLVGLHQTDDGNRYAFRHRLYDEDLVYYRIGLVNTHGVITAYTPSVQLRDEAQRTRVYPTVVRTGNLFVQTGVPYERMQVLNSNSQVVYDKALGDNTGTLEFTLPQLPAGIYFVRLLSDKQYPHVQKIMVQ